jgi:hypothetical protein
MTDQVPILSTIDPASLTKAQRSILLYAECCLVDHGGLLEGKRMNDADLRALTDFQDAGLLRFGRLPFRAIAQMVARECTHWVVFSSAAWDLAHAARRHQSKLSKANSANCRRAREALLLGEWCRSACRRGGSVKPGSTLPSRTS